MNFSEAVLYLSEDQFYRISFPVYEIPGLAIYFDIV
jgi:hypothetical protein